MAVLVVAVAACGMIFTLRLRAQQQPSLFSSPTMTVAPSPKVARQLALPPGAKVLDLDVSSAGPDAAILVRSATGSSYVDLWDISTGKSERLWSLPDSFRARSIAWHPNAKALFLLGRQRAGSVIIRLDHTSAGWRPRTIFRYHRILRRLVAGPRPFETWGGNSHPFYRLFFGVERPDKTYFIASISEQGKRYYELTRTKSAPPARPLSTSPYHVHQIVASSALPMDFHPAGHLFIWENSRQCFQVAHYQESNWGESRALLGGKICGGSVTPTPNGVGLLRWRRGMHGIELLLPDGKHPSLQAPNYTFLGTPSSVPDGRGIVGTVRSANSAKVVYVPIHVPLANVANAWMFLQSPRDLALFVKHQGLFRLENEDYDQLYDLYDSEAYACDEGYDASRPTRPYLVTTDLFLENLAAAYDGLFILLERRQAIPAFWEFINGANPALEKTAPRSAWAHVFRVLVQVEGKQRVSDPEAKRIMSANGVAQSSILHHSFDYSELKPRGHYSVSTQDERYFKAFRYLTTVTGDAAWSKAHPLAKLKTLPVAVQAQARKWIRTYLYFIAPSRSPLLWSSLAAPWPAYARHLLSRPAIFPLSWGFDNEVLLSTVFHQSWPPQEQITGKDGPRLLPSGLDVAAALGNPVARTVLSGQIRKYPPLATALNDLSARFKLAKAHPPNDLYERWIDTLATYWTGKSKIPGEPAGGLWATKHLQTGLASWATLRHATVLLNVRTSAECGEGGFEWILLTPPRGYVEPTPKTFDAIAGFFDGAADFVRSAPALSAGNLPNEEQTKIALRKGLLRRLGQAAAKARLFAGIARKELQGIPQSSKDYDEILYVNRTAEYEFLIFNSLANPEFALSNPAPIPKVADVAGNDRLGYLNAAVGNPLEWDQIVPYFGRREIVKGSVYSYYQFTSKEPLTDREWRRKLPSTPRPSWVTPFISNLILSCPVKNPY